MAFSLLAAGVPLAASAQQGPPNIILILTDDQSWNGTSVAMDPSEPGSASDFYQTPVLESLASEGMRFSNAYSAAPVCSPTRAALVTGQSTAQLSFSDIIFDGTRTRTFEGHPLKPVEWRRVDASTETLPRRVKAADNSYVTGHVGKWHLAPGAETLGYDHSSAATRAPGVSGSEDPGSVFARTEAAKSFIDDRVAEDRPFFLQVSHFAVHVPVEGQPDVIEKYENLPPGTRHRDPRFAAFTEALDTAVGQLLDHVDGHGLTDNTYVIYASDNGARNVESNNAPLSGFKGHVLEGGIRTPLVIKGPGIAGNTHSSVPVTTVDLFATVSDLAGNTTPFSTQVEGASLRPLLENGGALPDGMDFLHRQHGEEGAVYFWNPRNGANSGNYRIRPATAVRQGDYKLVRFYGENGEPDLEYLFNLADDFREDERNGSTDLSEAMPEQAARMSQLLDNWLESVDAPAPYDVKAPVDMVWHADQVGDHEDRWRAATDVSHRWRETWEVFDPDAEATPVAISSHLPGAPRAAFAFDGGDRFGRRFFDVSDARARSANTLFDTGTPDTDRSVTFETLVRFDRLNREQVLFESGDENRGVSLTLGDGDGDGRHDELRFRLLANDGRHLTVTGDIDDFAVPTRDFIQLTAVYNDDPDNRHVELFANGRSIGRVDGLAGDGTLDDLGSILWDPYLGGFEVASLGGDLSRRVGGAAGPGPQAFSDGWFVGEVASFRFANTADSPEQVQQNYVSLLDDPSHGVASVSGAVQVPIDRPASIAAGLFEADDVVQLVHERVDTLDVELVVDVLAEAGQAFPLDPTSAPDAGTLAARTNFASYLLHFDPLGADPGVEQLTGAITFEEEILGILYTESSLEQTETLFNVAGEFATGPRSLQEEGVVAVSADGRTLVFDLSLDAAALTQLRVLTFAPDVVGDFDGDGVVGLLDYELWANAYGEAGDSPADANGDGRVDAADYTLWRDRLRSRLAAGLGDIDGDGLISFSDYAIWQSEYGQSGGSRADLNGDGRVDAADYTLWRDDFRLASARVPEPTALGGLAVALLLSACVRARESAR